jgi:acyl carrier protein
MPSSSQINARVAKSLAQALGVEEEDIKPSATLQGDLGAESIDFLDIMFRLEREFGIKINKDELFPELILLGDSTVINDGRLTDNGLDSLQTHMPYADWSKFERNRRLDRIDEVFTVELVTSYIKWKLAGAGAAKIDLHSPAPHHSAVDPTLAAVPSGT